MNECTLLNNVIHYIDSQLVCATMRSYRVLQLFIEDVEFTKQSPLYSIVYEQPTEFLLVKTKLLSKTL